MFKTYIIPKTTIKAKDKEDVLEKLKLKIVPSYLLELVLKCNSRYLKGFAKLDIGEIEYDIDVLRDYTMTAFRPLFYLSKSDTVANVYVLVFTLPEPRYQHFTEMEFWVENYGTADATAEGWLIIDTVEAKV